MAGVWQIPTGFPNSALLVVFPRSAYYNVLPEASMTAMRTPNARKTRIRVRRAIALALAPLWCGALLLGFGHALAHHDAYCFVCVTAFALGKGIETPHTAAWLAQPPAAADLQPALVFTAPFWLPRSVEAPRGPPASC